METENFQGEVNVLENSFIDGVSANDFTKSKRSESMFYAVQWKGMDTTRF